MTCKEFPIEEPAMFIIDNDVAIAINMVASGDTRNADDLSKEDREGYIDACEAYHVIELCGGAFCCTDFEGTAYRINRDGTVEKDPAITFDENDDYLAGVVCDKVPALFSAVYNSFDDLAGEFRAKLAEYLPAGFPVEDHIFAVSGTSYMD